MERLPLDRARWPVAALIVSAAMLATAHIFQAFGYQPCPLCYTQRQIYWAAGAIALLGILAAWRNVNPRVLLAVNLALAAAFVASLGVAFYHAGVEYKIFPAPETCAVGQVDRTIPLSEQISRRIVVVSCGDAAWRMPAGWGLSMAGWNVIVSLGLVAGSFVSAFRAGRTPPRGDTANETSPMPPAAEFAAERRSA